MTLEQLIQCIGRGEQKTLSEVAAALGITEIKALRLIMVAYKTGIIELGVNTKKLPEIGAIELF